MTSLETGRRGRSQVLLRREGGWDCQGERGIGKEGREEGRGEGGGRKEGGRRREKEGEGHRRENGRGGRSKRERETTVRMNNHSAHIHAFRED